jgi:putative membrane protein
VITTATSAVARDFASNRVLQVLVVICTAVWVWAAIDPVYRMDWFLENILLFVAVGVLFVIYYTHPLSQLTHVFIAVFWGLHTVGSHYTYSEVPLGLWLQAFFDTPRNHYDRLVHLSFGVLLAYPIRELLIRVAGVRGVASFFFALTVIVTISEVYELIEWIVAQIVSPDAALAFLGTQGDVFDAQKDTGLALVGAVLTLTLTRLIERR